MMKFTLDRLPPRCEVVFVTSGPILTAYAHNIDTDVSGPLTSVDENHALEWDVLDPDGAVAEAAA